MEFTLVKFVKGSPQDVRATKKYGADYIAIDEGNGYAYTLSAKEFYAVMSKKVWVIHTD